MKAITTKEYVSLAVIAIIAPVLALALMAGARAALAAENDLLLLALTLCGSIVSGINGFGRRTAKAEFRLHTSRKGPHSNMALTS